MCACDGDTDIGARYIIIIIIIVASSRISTMPKKQKETRAPGSVYTCIIIIII